MRVWVYYLPLLFIISNSQTVFSQGRGNTWCFGDSVTLSMQNGNFVNLPLCNLHSIESSTSISDTNGNLLFYSGGFINSAWGYINIYDSSHQLMQNGDSIMGEGTVTNGLIILPFPNDTTKYYLFSRISTFGFDYHLYYSVIDINLNGGLGAVIQKNILLYDQQEISEKLAAVKHGNGTDWWLVTHQFSFATDLDSFSVFLITSTGILGPFNQSIGSAYSHSLPYSGFYGEIQFSNDGSKLVAVGENIIDLFDFDRCTGTISNYQNLAISNPSSPLNRYYGCSFSSEGSKLYISNVVLPGDLPSNQLFQFDLLSSNIPSSKTIIFNNNTPNVSLGQHQIAGNNKIYVASTLGLGFPNNNFGAENMNLSVINLPDFPGLSCSYNPYSVNLGGKRCFYGLPNIPNYNLGEMDPICNVGLDELESDNMELMIYPNPSSSIFSVTAISFDNAILELYDIAGCVLIQQPFNTRADLNISSLKAGIYLVEVRDKNGRCINGKVAKE